MMLQKNTPSLSDLAQVFNLMATQIWALKKPATPFYAKTREDMAAITAYAAATLIPGCEAVAQTVLLRDADATREHTICSYMLPGDPAHYSPIHHSFNGFKGHIQFVEGHAVMGAHPLSTTSFSGKTNSDVFNFLTLAERTKALLQPCEDVRMASVFLRNQIKPAKAHLEAVLRPCCKAHA